MAVYSVAEQNRIRRIYRDPRALDRIKVHYDLERRLADRLRSSAQDERKTLYTRLYDELFASLPDHPQFFRQKSAAHSNMRSQERLVRPMVQKDDVFLEVGAGDCRLCFVVAPHVARTIAVDVSDLVHAEQELPANFTFVKTDGITIDVPSDSVDFIYSNQLMEHLHEEDARQQLVSIHRALKPGGRYYCITPNAVAGPHDVSRYFDAAPTGFHIKEYRYNELIDLFRSVGFRSFKVLIAAGSRKIAVLPAWLPVAIEWTLDRLPWRLRQRLARFKPIRIWLGIRLIATK